MRKPCEMLETPKADTATTQVETPNVNAENVSDDTMGNQQPSLVVTLGRFND
jgi:hypothetical protein